MVKSQALKFIKSTMQRLQRTQNVKVMADAWNVEIKVSKEGEQPIGSITVIQDLERLSKKSLCDMCLDLTKEVDEYRENRQR